MTAILSAPEQLSGDKSATIARMLARLVIAKVMEGDEYCSQLLAQAYSMAEGEQ